MNTIGSSAAGRAAYTQNVNPSQESSGAASGPEKSASGPEKSSEAQQAPNETAAAQDKNADTLTTQERKAIAENFPDDPELSMRLYGRGRDAQTVNPDARGGNLDVTG